MCSSPTLESMSIYVHYYLLGCVKDREENDGGNAPCFLYV